MEPKRSPLDASHRALGAHMGVFGGWEMPISYTGTLAEHAAVRERVGLFDVSHLGKLAVRGDGAASFLDHVLTNRMIDLANGRARYTLMLTEEAGVVDDMIVYAVDPEELLVVPNAANVDDVERRMRDHAPPRVEIERLDWTTLAVQGPLSMEAVVAAIGDLPDLAYMHCARVGDVAIARSGYTGERGYEIFTTAKDAAAIWDAVLAEVRDRGGEPAGLAARDTLRLEMGYPLHGNDIDTDTTPREAHLDWAVAASKDEFVGKEAYRSRPARKELIGLKMEDRVIPRRGAGVVHGGRRLGEVTSGTFSPTLKIGIAMAYVEPGSLPEGERVEIEVRDKRGAARVTRPPFVARSPK